MGRPISHSKGTKLTSIGNEIAIQWIKYKNSNAKFPQRILHKLGVRSSPLVSQLG